MMGGGQGVKNESKIQALIPGPTKLQCCWNKEDRGASPHCVLKWVLRGHFLGTKI